MTLDNKTSLNDRLILEPYRNEGGLKTTVNHGIAMVSQKVAVKGLKVLIDAKLKDGTVISAGSIAYVKEELLHTQPWAKKILESDAIITPFMIVDLNYVDFVVPAQ